MNESACWKMADSVYEEGAASHRDIASGMVRPKLRELLYGRSGFYTRDDRQADKKEEDGEKEVK